MSGVSCEHPATGRYYPVDGDGSLVEECDECGDRRDPGGFDKPSSLLEGPDFDQILAAVADEGRRVAS